MARSSAGLEVLVPKEGMLPTGDTTFLLNWQFRLSPGHLGASDSFVCVFFNGGTFFFLEKKILFIYF